MSTPFKVEASRALARNKGVGMQHTGYQNQHTTTTTTTPAAATTTTIADYKRQ